MKDSSKPLKHLKKKQIHFWIEDKRFKKWDSYRKDRGYTSISAFIVNCVENTIDPYHMKENDFDSVIKQLKIEHSTLLSSIKSELQDLSGLSKKHSDDEIDEEISIKILQYLKKAGKSTEYAISSDLNIDIEDAYHTLCFLVSKNEVESVSNKKGVFWVIKNEQR